MQQLSSIKIQFEVLFYLTRRVTVELGSDLFLPVKLEHSRNGSNIIR